MEHAYGQETVTNGNHFQDGGMVPPQSLGYHPDSVAQQQQQQHVPQYHNPHQDVPGQAPRFSTTSDQTSTGGYSLTGGTPHGLPQQQPQQAFVEQQQQQQQHYDPQHPSQPQNYGQQQQQQLFDQQQQTQEQLHSNISAELSPEHLDQLLRQGFSMGLAKALAENAKSFDHRIWVVDNSGSMQMEDGHRIANDDGRLSMVPVSRWEEIKDTVIYHSQMAAVLKSFTRFRLLNDPGPAVGRQEFTVATPGRSPDADIAQAHQIMNRAKPDGVTPLTEHIWAMQAEIRQIAPELQRVGRRVVVVLATDGLPTDNQGYGGDEITQDFIKALRSLEGLPIWLVIRLCTDESQVTEFYNQLDGMLELSLEVLDDFMGECEEVQSFNPWLNYALPMHRCRELGYHDRLFDLIDERPLTKGELRDFCALLFGTEIDKVPDPVVEWGQFIDYLKESLANEHPQWNPLKKKVKPWISVKKLNKIYNKEGCSVM